MPTNQMKTPSAVISLFVINGNERAAVYNMLDAMGWQRVGDTFSGGLPQAKFGYRVTQYHLADKEAGLVRLDLVWQTATSNLPMSVNTLTYFRFLEHDLQELGRNGDAYPVRYALLYGCAGAAPELCDGVSEPEVHKTPSGLSYRDPVGSAVLVKSATWVENGEWVTCQDEDSDAIIDAQLAKVARFSEFTAECPPSLMMGLHDRLGLRLTQAFCTDKVIKLRQLKESDLSTTLADSAQKATVRKLLRKDFDIVDMESYGFLACVPEDIRNVAVIRVLTDNLSSKEGDDSDSLQYELLDMHAELTLRHVLEYLIARCAEGRRPAVADEASVVAVVLFELAERVARVAARKGKVDLSDVRRIVDVASMKLADLDFPGDDSEYDDPDVELLFAIASDIREAANCGYGTLRFAEYARASVFDMLQADSIEIGLQGAYKGWELFCDFMVPSSASHRRGFYGARAREAVDRACAIVNQRGVGRALACGRSSDSRARAGAGLVAVVPVLEKRSGLHLGEVVLISRSAAESALPGASVAGSNAPHYLIWDGFQDDDAILQVLVKLAGFGE